MIDSEISKRRGELPYTAMTGRSSTVTIGGNESAERSVTASRERKAFSSATARETRDRSTAVSVVCTIRTTGLPMLSCAVATCLKLSWSDFST
ncbi:hypothetical protein DAEQUDRAFT_146879 [Daedalea quercina L-15889]|uniref:Uncharacterized protein n=1 Tax=Daedalea quercina L-15889 TaxID=1314783 RepID=A0A165KNK2_9APHY|nr:hypothetical protein DAEQUDRAFT_146879 [Daedalea quercina L-15889]